MYSSSAFNTITNIFREDAIPFAAVAFLIGIVIVQQMSTLPSLWWGLAALPALALAWWQPRGFIIVFFVLGFFWASFRAGLVLQDELPHALEGQDIDVVGYVADIPQATDYGLRFLFDADEAWLAQQSVKIPHRLLLSSSADSTVRAGERWKLRVRLSRPHGFQNPGAFDYEGYLFRNRIRARGYVRTDTAPELMPGIAARYSVDRVRQRLGERIADLVADSPMAGMVVALANGDARRVAHSQWDSLRATGTVHLVAISGLHISLIAGIAFIIGRFLWSRSSIAVRRCPAPIAGAVVALVAGSAYAALAGFVVPTQRALIMLAVAMTGILLRRRFPPSQLLAAALMAVLVYDPLSVMAAGFWLSFAAVAILVFIASADDKSGWRRIGYLQLAVALGMLPLLLALFGQVSLVSPLANMIAIPVFDSIAVPLTLIGVMALSLSDTVAGFFFGSAAQVLEWLWPFLEWLGRLPFAHWTQHTPPWWALGCALVGVTVLLAPRGWPARWLGIVWLAPLFLVKPPTPSAGELWFTLLDVGQGLAAVVRTEHHTLIYDAGPRFSDSFDTGETAVVPYLHARGVRRVDTLVISHADNDHRGGAESVFRAFPAAQALSSAPDLPFANDVCVAGTRWIWDGVEFEMMHPPEMQRGRHNNNSCVLMTRSRYGSLLLTGDIEKRAEQSLVATDGRRLAAQIVVAPHHGSKTSSHAGFVDAVQPQYVLFPVGYRNRYRHPHPTVVERYRETGAHLYDSPTSGAIEFRFDALGTHVTTYRAAQRRYWFSQ